MLVYQRVIQPCSKPPALDPLVPRFVLATDTLRTRCRTERTGAAGGRGSVLSLSDRRSYPGAAKSAKMCTVCMYWLIECGISVCIYLDIYICIYIYVTCTWVYIDIGMLVWCNIMQCQYCNAMRCSGIYIYICLYLYIYMSMNTVVTYMHRNV
jgi:hypothetical protein